VAIACALAGTIIGIVSLTGLGQTLVGALITIVNIPFFASTGTSLLVALVLTMLACLVFGMGVPTTANYVIMATITAPMVLRTGTELGIVIPVLAAHMFVFYFGIVADITPPVALAAYAGAAIAKSDPIKTAVTATRLAITAFIVPFVFIFNPAMLLIDASLFTILQTFITTGLGMLGVAMGLAGYISRKLTVPWRLIAIAGGLCLIHPHFLADLAGAALIALVIVTQAIASKREKPISKIE
jgi:TRAP-type uncharacterized transport system fused permease subunit